MSNPLTSHSRFFALVCAILVASSGWSFASYPLTEEEASRLETYLPRASLKLKTRQPVHIVAIGDSVTRNLCYDEYLQNSHYAYHGVFAAELAREFFYTGGVRDIDPTRKNPPKRTESKGPELTLENLGMNGRISLHALSRLTTDAFANSPDLIIINFGINDALRGLSLRTYEKALQDSVDIIKAKGVDVILCGPSIIRKPDSLFGDGSTIVYGSVMKTVADRNGVLFVDFNSVTANAPGVPSEVSDANALRFILDHQRRNYEHGPDVEDFLHPSHEGHELLGKLMHRKLMGHTEPSPYRLGGTFTITERGKGVLEFKLKNLSEFPKKGRIFFPTLLDGLTPASETAKFELKAGKGDLMRMEYAMHAGADGTLIPFPFAGHEIVERFPVLVCDEDETVPGVVEAPVSPVTVVWELGLTDGAKDKFSVKGNLINTSQAPVNGTYEAKWNGQRVAGSFRMEVAGAQPFSLDFEMPRGQLDRAYDQLELIVQMDGLTCAFSRDVEVTRNMAIGDVVLMPRSDKYLGVISQEPDAAKVTMIPMADKKGLYLTFNAGDATLYETEKNSAVVIELFVDARAYGERRTFGFTDFVRFQIREDSGNIKISSLHPSVFGNGYDRRLSADNIKVSRKRLSTGDLQIAIMIPRSYFYLHEWALGNGNSQIGLHAMLRLLSRDPNNPDGSYLLSHQFSNSEVKMERHNAESLPALELDVNSTGRWSVRVH